MGGMGSRVGSRRREIFSKKILVGQFAWDFNLRCFASYDFHYIDLIVSVYSGGGMSTVNVDVTFLKDRVRNISEYFRNRLYRDEFLNDRFALRKLPFEKGKSLSLISKIYILCGAIILQCKVWLRRRIFHKIF